MSSKYRRAALSLICVAPLALTTAVRAQPMEPPQLLQVPAVETVAKTIAVRNVPPDVMAWWIDPTRQREPQALAQSRRVLRDYGLYGLADKGKFSHPQGIGEKKFLQDGEFLIADNPQSRLLLVGATKERARQIAADILVLDRPLRQLRVETQFIEVDAEAMKSLGVENSAAAKSKTAEFTADQSRVLQEMVADKHASIKEGPRISFINNLAGSVSTTRSTPIGATVEGDQLKIQERATVRLRLETRHENIAIATINDDDTITLTLRVAKTRWLTPLQITEDAATATDPAIAAPRAELPAVPFDTLSGQTSVMRMRDGATWMVSGLNTDLLTDTSHNRAVPTAAKPMLMLVTLRILRRDQ